MKNISTCDPQRAHVYQEGGTNLLQVEKQSSLASFDCSLLSAAALRKSSSPKRKIASGSSIEKTSRVESLAKDGCYRVQSYAKGLNW